jgi:tetratricopeptide (TPR) repeat protein
MNTADVFLFNNQAMESLQSGKVLNSERFLLQAQALLKSSEKSQKTSRLWAITYNNLACVYKTKGDSEKALKNLFLALETEKEAPSSCLSVSSIYLNIASIYSSMQFHKKSLSYVLQALDYLKVAEKDSEQYWTSLASAYLSAGNEYESLFQQESALLMFSEGQALASKNLGNLHILTIKLKKAMQNSSFAQIRSRSITPTKINVKKKQNKPSLKQFSEKFSLESPRNDFSPLNLSGISKKLPAIQNRLNRNNQGFHSVKRQTKAQELEVTKLKFGKISQNVKKNSLLPLISPSKQQEREKEFTLESDTEDQVSSLSSISEDIETKKLSDSQDPSQISEPHLKTSKPSAFQNLSTSDIGISCELSLKKSTKDKETQSLSTEIQTPSSFQRMAAQIIQKHWKNYKNFKNLKTQSKLKTKKSPSSQSRSNFVNSSFTSPPIPLHSKIFISK